MRIIFYTLVVYLAFSTITIGQKLPKDIEVKYDKFRDETTVELMFMSIESANPADKAAGRGYSSLAVSYSFPGQTLQKDVEQFYIWFSSSCGGRYCFDDPELIFLVDGKRFTLADRYSTTRTLSDSAMFEMTREEFARIAGASTVEYQIERTEGKLDKKKLEKLKTLFDLSTAAK